MSWNVEYVCDENGSYKALCIENKVIADISLLSDEFINKIIKIHNDELSQEYKEGVRVGINLMKENKN